LHLYCDSVWLASSITVAAELSEMLSVSQNLEIRQRGNGIYGLADSAKG